jgi:WD40 repeat protein
MLRELAQLKGHVGPVYALKFSADSNYCLSAGSDRIIRLWNPLKGTLIKSYDGHAKDVLGVIMYLQPLFIKCIFYVPSPNMNIYILAQVIIQNSQVAVQIKTLMFGTLPVDQLFEE